MTKVYLIRHAFTPANNAGYNNQKGLWQIALDKDMLLEKEYGEKQAIELGEFLNKLNGKILILASPYLRVQQTLKLALSQMHGDYDIKVVDDLVEFNSGIHYAHTVDEVLEMYPESKKYFEGVEKDLENAVYTGGESRNQVKERVKDIALKIQDISLSNKYDYILVFAHGTVNHYIYYWLTGEYIGYNMKNCEVVSVTDKESLFVPFAFVPKGFMINVQDYIDNQNLEDKVKILNL